MDCLVADCLNKDKWVLNDHLIWHFVNFQTLDSVYAPIAEERYSGGRKPENIPKNRYPDIFPRKFVVGFELHINHGYIWFHGPFNTEWIYTN